MPLIPRERPWSTLSSPIETGNDDTWPRPLAELPGRLPPSLVELPLLRRELRRKASTSA